MSENNDVFVWAEEDYAGAEEKIVREDYGWAIFNGGYVALLAKDDEVYNFPNDSIEAIYFLKPELFSFSGGVAIKIAEDYREFAKDKYGTDLIALDNYAGWKKLKKDQSIVADLMRIALILEENGVEIRGEFDKFSKMLK